MLTIDDFMTWLPNNGVKESTSSSYKSWLRTYFINDTLELYNKGDVKSAIDKIDEEYKNEKDRNRRSALNKLKDFIVFKNKSEMSVEQPDSIDKPSAENSADNYEEASQSDTDDLLPHPLNLILYGPPGTGKTYNTVNKALEIVQPTWLDDFEKQKKTGEKDERTYAQQLFNHYRDIGQIVFTTFHQSMSYEDFIEGIKPIPVSGKDKDDQIIAIHKNEKPSSIDTQFGDGTTTISNLSRMKYEVKDGIFKQISYKAFKAYKDYTAKFCLWIDRFVQSIEGKNKSLELETDKLKKKFKVWHEENSKSLSVQPNSSESDGNIKISIDDHLKKSVLYEKIVDWNPYVPAIIDYVKNTYETNEDIRDYSYVLIIDEINRGNVAQIFGELITLIEPSKRLGNEEAMTATLPYSSTVNPKAEPFGVPKNLYIIGTMNTADRSVEALDTALRRRFSFEEMMPKPELLKDNKNQDIVVCDVKLSDLLKTINARIVSLKDREHQIGHSYFMWSKEPADKEKWLTKVFKDKIIPLLQEYFYGDYKKIYYVLGPGFVKDSYYGKNAEDIRKELFPFVNNNNQDIDIPEERFEIESFDNIKIVEAIKTLMSGKSE